MLALKYFIRKKKNKNHNENLKVIFKTIKLLRVGIRL